MGVLMLATAGRAGVCELMVRLTRWRVNWLLLDMYDQFGALTRALNYLRVFPRTVYIPWFFNQARFSVFPCRKQT